MIIEIDLGDDTVQMLDDLRSALRKTRGEIVEDGLLLLASHLKGTVELIDAREERLGGTTKGGD